MRFMRRLQTMKGVTLAREPGPLEHAIRNLLSNTIKYISDGTRVDLSIKADATHACCEVAGTSLGIRAEAIATLFDCFASVANGEHRKCGGAGFGLAFVKTVAKQHRGDFTLTSIEGRGSSVQLTLPQDTPGS